MRLTNILKEADVFTATSKQLLYLNLKLLEMLQSKQVLTKKEKMIKMVQLKTQQINLK